MRFSWNFINLSHERLGFCAAVVVVGIQTAAQAFTVWHWATFGREEICKILSKEHDSLTAKPYPSYDSYKSKIGLIGSNEPCNTSSTASNPSTEPGNEGSKQ